MTKEREKYSIRFAKKEDKEQILELLSLAFGKKKEKASNYWDWKHYKSYFGPSYVLLAFDNNKLIAIRAFIRWELISNNQTYRCVRAVDTATHPNYQRQGLFSKLTYILLDMMKNDNVDFVFNNPNGNSLPGDLKMGWQNLGKSNIFFKIAPLNNIIGNRFESNKKIELLKKHEFRNIENLDQIITAHYKNNLYKGFYKKINAAYLKWRYIDFPLSKYGIKVDPDKRFFLIFKIVDTKKVRQLKICELFIDNKETISIKREINILLSTYRCDIATIACEIYDPLKPIIRKCAFINRGPKGSNFVVRNLNKDLKPYLDRKLWNFTYGDIENF